VFYLLLVWQRRQNCKMFVVATAFDMNVLLFHLGGWLHVIQQVIVVIVIVPQAVLLQNCLLQYGFAFRKS